jgi:molecular chaperone GrpE (heat shock protein)
LISKFIRFIANWFKLFRNQFLVFRLNHQVNQYKAKDYDRLAQNVRGLREALDTVKRSSEDLNHQLAAKDNAIVRLQADYHQLRDDNAALQSADKDAILLDLFARVKLALIQMPSLQLAIRSGKAITVQDIIDVYTPVEIGFSEAGFEKVGDAGDIVSFDPQLHNMVGSSARVVNPGDKVRIRYVGYRYRGRLVCKAEVVAFQNQESTAN